MENLNIAAAQFKAIKGNIQANIQAHLTIIQQAAEHGVNLIVFPELSLTGYEPELAQQLALDGTEPILTPLYEIAKAQNITLVVGCPVISKTLTPYIGALVIQASGCQNIYKKRSLHPGEEVYFQAADDNYLCLKTGDERVSFVICADINQGKYALQAHGMGASVYAAGVLMTQGGMKEALDNLSGYAAQYNMLTLMANFVGSSGGYQTAGQSAIWRPDGSLLQAADNTRSGFVMAQKRQGHWWGKFVTV